MSISCWFGKQYIRARVPRTIIWKRSCLSDQIAMEETQWWTVTICVALAVRIFVNVFSCLCLWMSLSEYVSVCAGLCLCMSFKVFVPTGKLLQELLTLAVHVKVTKCISTPPCVCSSAIINLAMDLWICFGWSFVCSGGRACLHEYLILWKKTFQGDIFAWISLQLRERKLYTLYSLYITLCTVCWQLFDFCGLFFIGHPAIPHGFPDSCKGFILSNRKNMFQSQSHNIKGLLFLGPYSHESFL